MTYPKHILVLDEREDADHKVEILYSRATCRIILNLTEKATPTLTSCYIPNDKARDAFLHPYCYV